MAQVTVSREIQARQVSTGALCRHELPQEAAPESDDHEWQAEEPQGGGAANRDPLDSECQRSTVKIALEYVNQRAREDDTTSEALERLLCFSPTDPQASAADEAVAVAKRFNNYSQLFESLVVGDKMIQALSDSVVEACRPAEEETDQGTGTTEPAGQEGPAQRPLLPRPEVAYQHLSDVFKHLFSWQEIRNATLGNIGVRFGLCLEYCYTVCKKYVQKYGYLLAANAAFGFICAIGGYMAKYLWQVFFYRRLAALGGWVAISNLVPVNKHAVAALFGVGLLLYAAIGYFFKT